MWDCKSTCGATPSSSRFWICRHFWVTTLTDPFFNKGTVLPGSCTYIVILWLPFLESIGGEGIWCFLLATGISKDESPWIILVFLVEREPWPGKWDKKAGQRKRIYLKNVPKGFIGLGKKQQSLGWRKKFRKFWDWKYYNTWSPKIVLGLYQQQKQIYKKFNHSNGFVFLFQIQSGAEICTEHWVIEKIFDEIHFSVLACNRTILKPWFYFFAHPYFISGGSNGTGK